MTDNAQADDGCANVTQELGASNEKEFRSPVVSYDVIAKVMAETWDEAIRTLGGPPRDPLSLWTGLARRILAAAGDGERDPERLKRIALRALES